MKLATFVIAGGNVPFPPAGLSGTFARFGEEVVARVPESELDALGDSAAAADISAKRVASDFDEGELYLVVEPNDSFRREHPDVTVVLDKGRYIAVLLERGRARHLMNEQSQACVHVLRPLRGREVVYEVLATAARPTKAARWVSDLVADVSRADVEDMLKRLASFPTRLSTSTHYAVAAQWAQGQLSALGYATRQETINVNGEPSTNVIAERLGRNAGSRRVVVVTAHLDSINLAGGPAPGADDNGSGCAGLLEIARVMAGHAGADDLRLILFGGEEQGMRGSRQHVAALPNGEKRRIKAVVNMDMIATVNTSAGHAVLLEGESVSQPVVDGLALAAAAHTNLTVQRSPHASRSDHVPFIHESIPAALTIEGNGAKNGNIHSERDTLDHINYDLLLEILRMNVAFVSDAVGR